MTDQPTPTFAAFWLLKARPSWQQLALPDRDQARLAFARALDVGASTLTLRGAYSLVGLRADADLLLWLHGPDFAPIQALAAQLRRTTLGAHLDWAYSYLGMATPAQYDPTHSAAFIQGAAPKRYLSIYPFIKTAEWYLLPFEDRRSLMAEHGRVGRRFSVPRAQLEALAAGAAGQGGAAVATAPAAETGGGVLTNTIHSFGLGDQEFVVAFESDDAAEMVRMVEALRATEVRRYTKLDTPIFLGLRKPVADALGDLG